MADKLGYSIFLSPADTVRAWGARGDLIRTVNWSEMVNEQRAIGFTVAKIAKLDLLRYIRESLDDVIRRGGTFSQWKAQIVPELKRRGWWGAIRNAELTGTDDTVIINERRLRTIYDTNVRMSKASGAWQKIQRNKDVAPYLRYMSSTSEHKRPLHKLWYGVILPVDHPWWQTHFPPNGWFCKCSYEQVTERQMRRNGWTVTPMDQIADGPGRAWSPASGGTQIVPAGIDPGFAYNPGTAHLRVIADKATTSINQALKAGLEEPAKQTVRELVADVAFDQFLALPTPSFPVLVIDKVAANAISASSRVAVLANGNTASGMRGAAVAPATVFRRLPFMPDQAEVIARLANKLVYLMRTASMRWTKATISPAKAGDGLVVTEVEEIEEAAISSILDGAEIIVDRR